MTLIPPALAQTFPLTIAQRGIWFAQRLAPPETVFNIAEVLIVDGEIKVDLFYEAMRQAALEASATRLRFVEKDGGPLQAINPEVGGILPLQDLSHENDPWAAFLTWAKQECLAPHDATRDRLWATGLLRAGPGKYFWYHRVHHILLDGFGAALLARRMAEIYNLRCQGTPAPLQAFGSLSDLVEEDHAFRSSEAFAKERDYWMKAFADRPEPSSLVDWKPGHASGMLRQSCQPPAALIGAAREMAAQQGVTFPQLMIAAVMAYMYRMTGNEDLVLGLPVTCRTNKRLRSIPAMLANGAPLRLSMRPSMTTTDVLQQVGKRVREALRHQRYRYEDLRRDLGLLAEGRQLFTTVVNIEPFDYDLRLDGAACTPVNLSNGSIEDLAIFIYDRGVNKGVWIDFDANPAFYTAQGLAAHQSRLLRLLQAMVANPQAPIGGIELLEPQEFQSLVAPPVTPEPAPHGAWLPQMIEAQVASRPFDVAVSQDTSTLLYTLANRQANRLARALMDHGVGADDFVAVLMPRDLELIPSLLGVMKCGAAYLPLDPDLPLERLTSMIRDAQVKAIIATPQTIQKLPTDLVANCPVLRPLEPYVEGFPAHDVTDAERRTPMQASHAAYVIYTSGSSGKPKGVIVTHGGLQNFMIDMQARVALEPTDRLLAVTTVGFDIAALELYLPLISGARVVIASRLMVRHPPALARLLTTSSITAMQATPSLWEILVQAEPAALKGLRMLVGGEAIGTALAGRLSELAWDLTNVYGPTETTIWSTAQALPRGSRTAPPIGRPMRNTQLYILDPGLQPVPVGLTGELYIAGQGLARGYLGRAALTAERFVANPFVSEKAAPAERGLRMYRTGDLARWNTDGSVQYLGRADQQVKIRGFRVELGEIEAVLANHPSVRQASVTVREDRPGDKRLVAYIVTLDDAALDITALRNHVAASLPDYMVPATVVKLDHLPLNPSGKLDRRALPAPESPQGTSKRGPRDPIEEVLCTLFAESLGVPNVDIDSNFFEMGGDSLMIGHMVSKVRAVLHVELPLNAMFEVNNIAGLANLIAKAQGVESTLRRRTRPATIPLSFAQQRLWFLSQLNGADSLYHIALPLRLRGHVDLKALQTAAQDVLQRHEILRTVFPEIDGSPVQRVLDEAQVPFQVLEVEAEAMMDKFASASQTRFNLAHEIPLRVVVLTLAADDHLLLMVVHHIAADGQSLMPLARDLAQAYTARLKKQAPAWQALPVQYVDYSLWQQEILGDEAEAHSPLARQIAFWRNNLAGAPAEIDLPFDHPMPEVADFLGDTAMLSLDADLHQALQRLARQSHISLFMLLHAGWAITLSKLGAGFDIPIGAPVAGRSDHVLDDLIGCFVNTVVLRTDLSGNPSIKTVLNRVRQNNLAAYAHQDLPFERLVEILNPPRSKTRHVMFQTMIALQNFTAASVNMERLSVSTENEMRMGMARFDLSLILGENKTPSGQMGGITGWIEYRTDLFERDTVERIVRRFELVLRAALAHPEQTLDQVDVLLDDERTDLVANWD